MECVVIDYNDRCIRVLVPARLVKGKLREFRYIPWLYKDLYKLDTYTYRSYITSILAWF